MRVRWTRDAADDLARIVEYVREHNPSAAQRIARMIYQGIASLQKMHERGRVGRVPETREIVFAPLPYVGVYEITEAQVRVLRIRHTSQDWP